VVRTLPSTAIAYIRRLADSPDTSCFLLFVGIVESWIKCTAEGFPKTAAGMANAQIDFEREKERKMHMVRGKKVRTCIVK